MRGIKGNSDKRAFFLLSEKEIEERSFRKKIKEGNERALSGTTDRNSERCVERRRAFWSISDGRKS
jgi:hypothetical protein